MNKKEYVKYLGNLISGIEIDENENLTDQFYAYFQCFMPEVENIEKVFTPLKNGKILLERILPIYE